MSRMRQFVLIGMIVLAAFGAVLMGDVFAAEKAAGYLCYFQ